MPSKFPAFRFRKRGKQSTEPEDHVSGVPPESFPEGFKTWFDNPDAVVDIVFVHGLTGDRERTWTHPDAKGIPWPMEFLPSYLPDARILTYGYDAYVLRKHSPATKNRVSEHARDLLDALFAHRQGSNTLGRPLIFVVHSLGGIVCKDALLRSRNAADKHLRDVLQCTRGIAFMGTPHTGSALANWAKTPIASLGVVKSANTNLLSVLQTNSEILSRVHTDFLEMLRTLQNDGQEIEITCFYETLPKPFIGIVVPRESAILAGYDFISLHADHRDMVRYLSRDDEPGLRKILGVLTRWVQGAKDTSKPLYASAEELEKAEQRCLASLAFGEMDALRADIETPVQNTCTWIFDDSMYRKWYQRNPESDTPALLWIKGKPGSGKSTLLKDLFMRYNQDATHSKFLCLGFFFNARGSELERSPLGLYRTLLSQLCRQSRSTFRAFLQLFAEKQTVFGTTNISWRLSELSDFFHAAVAKPAVGNVLMFVDALDECNEDEVRRFICNFHKSAKNAILAGANLRACWSSRHYPYIRVESCLELFLEQRNENDIKHYVEQEFRLPDLHLAASLTAKIISRASGVFLWAVLVVRRLLKASDQGLEPREIECLVESLPTELEELFAQMANSMNASQLATSLTIAQWALTAYRPLRAHELHTALRLGQKLQLASTEEVDLFKDSDYDLRRFDRYVTDTTCGMFEIVYRDAGHIVQFIHESVRDFLLSPSGLGIYGLLSDSDFNNTSKDLLAMSCQRFFGFMRIHAALPPPGPNGFVPVTALTASCYRSTPSSPSLLACPLLSYMIQFGLKHVKRSLWFISRAEAKLFDKGLIQGLRNMLECLFVLRFGPSASKVSIGGYENQPTIQDSGLRDSLSYISTLSPKIPHYDREFLDFIASHSSTFGLSTDDFSRLAACVNNKHRFLRDLHVDLYKGLRSKGDIQPNSAFKFHQFFWATATGARDDEVVHQARRLLCLSSSHSLSAMEAFHLCETNAKGFAFLAHFTYNYTRKENTTLEPARPSTQIQWELSDDLEEYMHFRSEVLGCQNDNFPSSIPFHTVSDSGYISLLIRESIDTGTTTADLRYTAFGIRQREYDDLWRSPDIINRIMRDDISLHSFDSRAVEVGMRRQQGHGHWILLPDTGVPTTSEGSSTGRPLLTTSNLQCLTEDYRSKWKREHRSLGRSSQPEPKTPEPAANAIDITNVF